MKTETSSTSPIGINQVVPPPENGAGWVAITLAPGKKTAGTYNYWDRDLDADLDRLKELGVTMLVPLLENDELDSLKIMNLVASALDRGLEVQRFPFHDGGVPKSIDETVTFVREIVDFYREGERILIHCNGGLGRAGTMAACVRLALVLDDTPKEAIASIRQIRSKRAVETREQEEFIRHFHKAWKKQCVLEELLGTDDGWPLIENRLKGALYGLAVGDALGAPVEFMSAEDIKAKYGKWTEMRAGGPWAIGEWTDDTSLALSVAQGYADTEFDLNLCAKGMVDWFNSDPKDVGNQTRLALGLIRDGIEPIKAGEQVQCQKPGAAGNGSLMRAAPTGLARTPSDPKLKRETADISAITHADKRCIAACVVFNMVLSSMVHEHNWYRGLMDSYYEVRGIDDEVTELVSRIEGRKPPIYEDKPIGYVLLCLERALLALKDFESFEEGLVWVIGQGGDTDTNAAVAGALLGAKCGFDAIPKRWIDALGRKDKLERAYGWLVRHAKRPHRREYHSTNSLIYGLTPQEGGVYEPIVNTPGCGDASACEFFSDLGEPRITTAPVRVKDSVLELRVIEDDDEMFILSTTWAIAHRDVES